MKTEKKKKVRKIPDKLYWALCFAGLQPIEIKEKEVPVKEGEETQKN